MSVGAIQTLRSAGSPGAVGKHKRGIMCYGAFVWGNGPPEVPEARRCGARGRGPAWNRGATGSRVLAQEASSLIAEFESAATEYGVPQDLLLAMGYVNTMWEMPPPRMTAYREDDIHGRGAYGIMQLVRNPWEDTLGEAARLTGLSEEQLKNDRAANIRGGAAVLAGIQGQDRPADLNGWQEAVAEYGGIDLYATEVYETLRSGASATISTGGEPGVGPAGRGGTPDLHRPAQEGRLQEGGLEAGSPRELHEPRAASNEIDMIVVHIARAHTRAP